MMYLLRGVVISFSAFFVLYVTLSSIIACISRAVIISSHRSASQLYWLRMLPLFGALVATLALVLPAFLAFEPQDEEAIGTIGIGLAVAGVTLVLYSVMAAFQAWARSARYASAPHSAANLLVVGIITP